MSDIYLKPTSSGQDINVSAGMPQMSGGLDNAVYMSLFTVDYWGNDSADDTSGKYDSTIPTIISEATLTNQARLNIIAEAERVTAWLVSDGIVDSITVSAEIPEVGWLYLAVQCDEPERTINFKYGVNWDTQKINLVNEEPELIKEVRLFTYVSDIDETFVSDIGETFVSDSYLV